MEFSFKTRLVVEVLEILEATSKSSEYDVRVFVNAVKRKARLRRDADGKLVQKDQTRLIFGGDGNNNEIVTLEDFIHLQVYSKDVLWKREIGVCETRLAELISAAPGVPCDTDWLRLRAIDGRETGKVLLRLSYTGDDVTNRAGATVDPNHNMDASSIDTSTIEKNGVSSSFLFKASREGRPLNSMVEPRWILRLRIYTCRDLRAADTIVGASDPYCEIRVRNEVQYTDIVFRDLNPVFPQRVFEFGEGLDVLGPHDDVTIAVYDHDRLKKPDFLGCLVAPIWALCGKDMKPQWFHLVSQKIGSTKNAAYYQDEHKTRGRILIGAEFIHPPNRMDCEPLPVHLEPKDVLKSAENGCMPVADVKLHERSEESVRIYKPYKGKIWLHHVEVTALQVRGLDMSSELVLLPVGPRVEGPPNAFIAGSKSSKSGGVLYVPTNGIQSVSTRQSRTTGLRPRRNSFVSEAASFISKEFSPQENVSLAQRVSRKLFCEFRCGGQISARFRTKPCRDSRSPSWRGETFVCGKAEGGIRIEHSSIGVALMTRNLLGQDFLVGTTVFDLTKVCEDMGYIDFEGKTLVDWFELHRESVGSPDADPVVIGSIQLRITLKPMSQTRVSTRECLALKLEFCTGLKTPSPSTMSTGTMFASAPKHVDVFARVRLENESFELVEVKESAPSTVRGNGEAHFDQLILFDEFQPRSMRLVVTLHDYHSGEECGRTVHPITCFAEDAEERWPLMIEEGFKNDMVPVKRRAELKVAVKRVRIHSRRYLPILGTLSIKLHSLRLPTHDFKHDIRVVIRYGESSSYMTTRVYERDVNVMFSDDDSRFAFLVRNPHEEIEIQVRDLFPHSQTEANSNPLAGRFIARHTITCFDVIEAEFSHTGDEARLHLPVYVSSKLDSGFLELTVKYSEKTSAILSKNATPLQVPVPPFSLERSAKEMRRFASVLGWPHYAYQTAMDILSWQNPITSLACLILMVLFCSIPALTERPLLFFPCCMLAYLTVNYRKRMDGQFIARFITQRTSLTNACKHASVKVCVIKAKNLLQRPHAVHQGFRRGAEHGIRPVFAVKVLDVAKSEETLVGHSLPLDRSTRNPDWSYRTASNFRTIRGSTLVSWRTNVHEMDGKEMVQPYSHSRHSDDHRQRFNARSNHAFMFVIERKSDESVLVVRLHKISYLGQSPLPHGDDYRVRIGARGGSEARQRCSKEVTSTSNFVFEEDIVCPIEPDEVLQISFGRANDVFEIAEGEVDDPFRVAPGRLIKLRLLSKNLTWPRQDDEELSAIAFAEIEFFHFGGDTVYQQEAPFRNGAGQIDGPIGFLANTLFDLTTVALGSSLLTSTGSPDSSDSFRLGDGKEDAPPLLPPPLLRDREVFTPKKESGEASTASLVAWKRQPDAIVIELRDRTLKGPFLGRAILPLSRIITDLDSLEQPTFTGWLTLEPRYDGSNVDGAFCQLYSGESSILVSAQVTLPHPVDEAALKEDQEARKARFPHEKFQALARQADKVYREARAFNDRMERIKNTFNWAVVSRTRLVHYITVVLFLVFAIVPSRFIILAVGLYLFTERFRPHGIVVIAINHMFALAPTDEDFARVVSREIFGRVKRHKRARWLLGKLVRSNRATPHDEGASTSDESDDDDDENDAVVSAIGDGEVFEDKLASADARFKRAMRQIRRSLPVLSSNAKKDSFAQPDSAKTLQSFIQRRLGSIVQGYLRVLERHLRGVWFRRYFFVYDGQYMMYWAKRKDFLNKLPSLGRIGHISKASMVEPGSREAILAFENDARKIDSLFVLEQTKSGFAHPASSAGSTFGNLFRQDLLNGKTLFAANSIAARNAWIKALHPGDVNGTQAIGAETPDDEVI